MSRKSSRSVSSTTRVEAVRNAVYAKNLKELQELSLLPGGFGNARGQAWVYLLGVDFCVEQDTSCPNLNDVPPRGRVSSLSESWTQAPGSSAPTSPGNPSASLHDSSLDGSESQAFRKSTDLSPHPDEHQVQLDTNRSFILYPIVDRSVPHRKHLQEELHDVILGVLRKRPTLRYFQGYHDIMTVLFLTLPIELVLPSAEKLSLHRLRDSMGSGLEPLVGQLRILKRLLRLVDPPYADILERNSSLPYYALSNLLTLFAHDVPTLPLIQHVFDWLLCREPIASIWLAAAIILSRKEDVLVLEREGEEAMGMMHAVLSALPPLSEEEAIACNSIEAAHNHKESAEPEMLSFSPGDAGKTREGTPATSVDSEEHETVDQRVSSEYDPLLEPWPINSPRATSPPIMISGSDSRAEFDSKETVDPTSDPDEGIHLDRSKIDPDATHSRTQLQKHSQTLPRSSSTSQSFPGEYKEKETVPSLPLPKLLRQASELLEAYPPLSPPLRLTETFGLQSALRAGDLPEPGVLSNLQDDEAEACVGGDNVVLPLSQEEQEEEFSPPRTTKESHRASNKGKIRNRRPIRFANGVVVRRQTVVTGVVLLLGVAVALYGFGPGGRGAGRNGTGKFGGGNMRWMAAWMAGLLGVGERLRITL